MAKKAEVELKPLPPVEEVAQAVIDISVGVKRLSTSRLTWGAIVLLLHSQCRGKVGVTQIRLVLQELERMDKAWLKPLETKGK